jgi:hypothetical protein
LAALPQAVGGVIGFVLAGAGLSDKFGRHLIHVGTGAIAAGVGAIEIEMHLLAHVTPWTLTPMLAVMGLGLGLTLAPFFNIVLAGVEMAETGSASGALTALQQFGGAIGVAVLGTVFFDLLIGRAHGSFPTAMKDTLWVVLGLQVVTFVLAFLLPKKANSWASEAGGSW